MELSHRSERFPQLPPAEETSGGKWLRDNPLCGAQRRAKYFPSAVLTGMTGAKV